MDLVGRRGHRITVPDSVAPSYFEQGYRPASDPAPAAVVDLGSPLEVEVDLEALTYPELLVFAARAGVQVGDARDRAQVLAALGVGPVGE